MINLRPTLFIGLLAAAVPLSVFAAFSDVASSHPNADAISYVEAKGIVSGYADGTFKPDAQINRAEFTKIAIGAMFTEQAWTVCDPNNVYSFFDVIRMPVVGRPWYSPFLCVAVQSHVIKGYEDGSFRPMMDISFTEAAKILVEADRQDAVGNPKYDRSLPTVNGPWYAPYVQYLQNRGAIPMSITHFDQLITRGEMAEMIYRLKTGVTDKPSRSYEDLSSYVVPPDSSLLQKFPSADTYFVILATSSDQASANVQARDLDAWVLPTDLTSNLTPHLYAVVKGPFSSTANAQNYLRDLQSRFMSTPKNAYVKNAGSLSMPPGFERYAPTIPIRVLVAMAGRVMDVPLADIDIDSKFEENGASLCATFRSIYSFAATRNGVVLKDAMSPTQVSILKQYKRSSATSTDDYLWSIQFDLPVDAANGEIIGPSVLCFD